MSTHHKTRYHRHYLPIRTITYLPMHQHVNIPGHIFRLKFAVCPGYGMLHPPIMGTLHASYKCQHALCAFYRHNAPPKCNATIHGNANTQSTYGKQSRQIRAHARDSANAHNTPTRGRGVIPSCGNSAEVCGQKPLPGREAAS